MKKMHSPCPVDRLLRILMGPWTTYILWLLYTQGEKRFGELRRDMPAISAKILTERLRMLESEGLILRTCVPTIPPAVSYQMTEKGLELQDMLSQLLPLALKWFPAQTKENTMPQEQKSTAFEPSSHPPLQESNAQ